MEVLESWFGAYPFADEKYGHAEVTFSGAMEHQTLTSMGSRLTNVVAHELAHQWFGDMVSPRAWRDLWLNEGFATYSELLYWEAYDAEAPGTHALLVRNTTRNATFAEGTLVLEDTTSVIDMFNPTRVYAKGAIVLHMLRSVVGDAAFRDILLAYASDPAVAYGSATTADFERVAEAVHGASLDTFLDQWVRVGTGYPHYSVSSYLVKEGDFRAFVTVEQTQAEPESNVDVFVMPVTIAVQTSAGEERFTVMNDRRRQTFEFDVVDKPIAVTFDPDLVLLRDVELETADAVLQRAPAFQGVTPNPSGTSSALRFTLPDDRPATLGVYDVAGRRVRTFAVRGAGPHKLTLDLDELTSGVYFLRLDAPTGTDTRKLVVVR
jgi:aminopeptidase N